MKNFAIFSACLLFLGCSNVAKTEAQNKPQIIGGDRDAHGCLAPAGYQWSITRNSCVRVWEVGIRLYRPNSENVSTDIVIMNGDGPMELHYADSSLIAIFNKIGNVWINDENQDTILKKENGEIELRNHIGILIASSKQ